MNYLLDTNILLALLRANEKAENLASSLDLFSPTNTLIISAVSIGELKSIAIRNNWGVKRINEMTILIEKMLVIGINYKTILDKYAEIDTFSQGKLNGYTTTTTARNMGKNDLWIAATASVYNLKLLTSDNDFQHLDSIFIELNHIIL